MRRVLGLASAAVLGAGFALILSSATTLAAARGRAPDWTRWRSASTAKLTSWS